MLDTTISHYRVLESLGQGGMGVVYKAEDVRLERLVALKFLPDSVAHDPDQLARFRREARAASALNHPNICTIYDIGEENGRSFIVMEYLEGKNLKELIGQSGQLPLPQVLSIASGILEGLQAAHEKGILHRDIKPANIFITDRGVAKILDFGLAKQTKHDAPDGDASQTRGWAFGTIAYMSPEQALGKKLDARADLFSFGTVLYEMATGATSFGGDSTGVVFLKVVQEKPVPPRRLNPDLPAKLDHIIQRCLEKDREKRYQSAAEILDDLRQLQPASGEFKVATNGTQPSARHTPSPDVPRVKTSRVSSHIASHPWRAVAVVTFLIAVAGAAAFWATHARSEKLTEKDTIVISEFINTTGDPIFDNTLRQAASADLGQSPIINVLSDRRIAGILLTMGRPSNQRLTGDVARQVCIRSGSKALIVGSISQTGEKYQLALKALNCENQDVLASVSAKAENKRAVLTALSHADSTLRNKMGESLASLTRFNLPLEEATTASLPAWQAYTDGVRTLALKANVEALPKLELATKLDPNFALAYARLAIAYVSSGQMALASENFSRAFQLRHRVSERERFYIEAGYYLSEVGDMPKALQSLTEWTQVYPGDGNAYNMTGIAAISVGDYEKAAQAFREVIRIAPESVNGYTNLTLAYIELDRYDEAKATYDSARSRGLDAEVLRINRYVLAFLENDGPAMQEQLDFAAGKPGFEDRLLKDRAEVEAYYGHYQDSLASTEKAVASALKANAPERAREHLAFAAVRSAKLKKSVIAKKLAARAEAGGKNGHYVRELIAEALAFSGDLAGAQRITDDLAREYPQSTVMQGCELPTIRAVIALRRNNPAQALDELKPAERCEFGDNLDPAYVRGLAYLQLNQGNNAVAEFKKLVEHPGSVQFWINGSLALVQLARAEEMSGERSNALRHYEDFLASWKTADPDLPILNEAKSEYATLKQHTT